MLRPINKSFSLVMLVKVLSTLILMVGAVTPLWAFEEEIDTLARNISERIGVADMKTVAVVDFTDVRGNKTELGRFLAEEVSVALLTAPTGLQLVDRAHLSKILEETKLGESGIVDPETAKELGRIAGVDIIITGTITPLEETVRLTVKVLATETASLITGDRVSLSATGPIRELLARGLNESSGAAHGGGVHTRAYEMATREAGGLKMTAKAVRVLKEGRIAVLLELFNSNSYPVRVGIPYKGHQNSQCIDNKGNLFEQNNGLGDYFSCDDDYGLALAPGESQQITELYRGAGSEDRKHVGNIFQVNIKMTICRPQDEDRGDGKLVQFTFSDLPADSITTR